MDNNQIISRLCLNQAQIVYEGKPAGMTVFGVQTLSDNVVYFNKNADKIKHSEIVYKVVGMEQFMNEYMSRDLILVDITEHNIPIIRINLEQKEGEE